MIKLKVIILKVFALSFLYPQTIVTTTKFFVESFDGFALF